MIEPNLDEQLERFSRCVRMARQRMTNGNYVFAFDSYLHAATIAPSPVSETYALEWAWHCHAQAEALGAHQ